MRTKKSLKEQDSPLAQDSQYVADRAAVVYDMTRKIPNFYDCCGIKKPENMPKVIYQETIIQDGDTTTTIRGN